MPAKCPSARWWSTKEEIIARAQNRVLRDVDPTAHAEIVALRAAAMALGNYRLSGCALYVTVEPCAMCAGAMIHARIDRLVFAAADPKAGACGSVLSVLNHPQLNHQMQVEQGIGAEKSAELLRGVLSASGGSFSYRRLGSWFPSQAPTIPRTKTIRGIPGYWLAGFVWLAFLGVVGHALKVDEDRRFIADDPAVVSWWNMNDIAGYDGYFGAVVHAQDHFPGKLVAEVSALAAFVFWQSARCRWTTSIRARMWRVQPYVRPYAGVPPCLCRTA